MVELAEIFRVHGPGYRAAFADRMPPSHLRAMDDIEQCRTAERGGSLYACPSCPDVLQYSYHSCGNRACPKCGNDDTSEWLDHQRQFLLPVDYFLVTYTLPAECRAVARANQKVVYSAFFRASAESFSELASQPKHLGGQVGLMGVLQTWRRDLDFHVHIHYLVPGGALSADNSRWRPHRYNRWLVPEKALAARFKQRFKLELDKAGFLEQIDPVVWTRSKKWVVDSIPVGNGEQVLKYLAPYIHRVAISNQRIESLHDGKVTFRFKDRDSDQWRHMTLPAQEFIRRFLQHVLPKRFVKIRYYGFLAAKVRRDLLPRIRELVVGPDLACNLAQLSSRPGQPPSSQQLHASTNSRCVPAPSPVAVLAAPALCASNPDSVSLPAAVLPLSSLSIPLSALQPGWVSFLAVPTSAYEQIDPAPQQSPTPHRHHCPTCGTLMVLVRTLPRLYTRQRAPPQ